MVWGRINIHAEVTQPLELETEPGLGITQARLNAGFGYDFQ